MAANPPGMPAEVTAETAYKQFREFLISYNKLTELCFNDCVNDYTTRKILDSEQNCTTHCMDKYLKMTQRISQRFQEYQAMMNEAGIGQVQKP